MPIYDYVCTTCGRTVEVVHGINAPGPTTCDACEGTLKKAISRPAIHFKGSGWAKKDAHTASRAKAASAGGKDGSEAVGVGTDAKTQAAATASGDAGARSTDGAGSSSREASSSGAGSEGSSGGKSASSSGGKSEGSSGGSSGTGSTSESKGGSRSGSGRSARSSGSSSKPSGD